MSQESIIRYLMKHPGKRYTSDVLAKRLGICTTSINNNLLRLRRKQKIGLNRQLRFERKMKIHNMVFYYEYWWQNRKI